MKNEKSSTVFSYKEFEDIVRRFAETVPQLLVRHPATSELAFQIERLHLTESLASRFTVAIIGQMRVGKSTLLNALIGRKLAPTGITETTATINWFRYGTGELCNKFRVHWKDGSTEDMPLEQATDWIGAKENADKTNSLDFFADSEFLANANIVDTPGTRSVLKTHEEATQGVLAEKLEAETFKYGGRADAVIYAINPIGREADRDLLQLFGERTRLSGASAYNSIAVVQKWEHFEDPLIEARRKCDRLRLQLQDKVSEVIPTSGLLANMAMEISHGIWDKIAKLVMKSTQGALDDLLLSPEYFCEDIPGSALDHTERKELCKLMEWAALRFSMHLARSRKIDDGKELRNAILDASGIEKLKSVLENRFFSLAGLIQASTVLRKAWDPCNIALLKLRDISEQRKNNREIGRQSTDILNGLILKNPALGPVARYVRNSLESVEIDLKQVEEIRGDLDRIKYQAENNFMLLDRDISYLEVLETLSDEDISDEEKADLRYLFGGHGPDIWIRLRLKSEEELNREVLDRVWDMQDHWKRRKATASGELKYICEQAATRLSMILDCLEETIHG